MWPWVFRPIDVALRYADRMGRLWLILVLAVACGPGDVAGSVKVEIVAVGADGSYGIEVETVEVRSLRRLEGETTRFVTGAELAVEEDNELEVRGGRPIQLRLAESGGVYESLDYEGLIALSAYHHMQEAHALFREVGLGEGTKTLPQMDSLFLPALDGASPSLSSLRDNAAYAYTEDSFLLLRESVLDEVPLAANQGIIAHEFSHAVLDYLTTTAAGEIVRPEARLSWDRPSVNHWRSVDEGLADVFAAAFTGDPDFIRPSGGEHIEGRDLSGDHAFTEEIENDASYGFAYDPYPLGSVVAATFWDYARELEADGMSAEDANREMAHLAFGCLEVLELQEEGFHAVDLLNQAIAEAPGSEARALFCQGARDRFARVSEEIAGCP